jgi:hypothetical protein
MFILTQINYNHLTGQAIYTDNLYMISSTKMTTNEKTDSNTTPAGTGSSAATKSEKTSSGKAAATETTKQESES